MAWRRIVIVIAYYLLMLPIASFLLSKFQSFCRILGSEASVHPHPSAACPAAMQDPFCPRCGFLQRGVFCSPSLGCYFPKLEMMREKLERKRAFCSDFDPLDYDGTSGGKKAKRQNAPACNPSSRAPSPSGFIRQESMAVSS